MGDGPGGPPPGRSRRRRGHPARHRGGEGAARRRGRLPACARQQCGHLAQGRAAVRGSGRSTPATRTGCGCSRSISSPRSCWPAACGRTHEGQGLGRQRDLHRGLARPSLRRRGLCHLQGGARRADPRDGRRFRAARRARERHLAGRDRHRDPVAGHREDRRAAAAAPPRHARTKSPRRSTSSAPTRVSYVTGAELHINGGQHVCRSIRP